MSPADILASLEKLTGPSEEIDAEILCLLAAPAGSKVEQSRFNGAWCIYEPRQSGKEPFALWEWRGWHRARGWPVTGSLDAIVALIEQKLPGAEWTCTNNKRHPDAGPFAEIVIRRPGGNSGYCATNTASSAPAIAMCIALLKAMESGQ